MDEQELERGLAQYTEHLQATADVFNTWCAHNGLPVEMDPSGAIRAVRSGIGLARIAPFWTREDDSGIVHETQLKTAIDCFVKLLSDPKRCGHIVGAMQSGKTTTSLALQWAGPILYLLAGERPYPFYIIGSQTNHEDQTNTELNRFIAYYGNLEFRRIGGGADIPSLDAMFKRSPSLATYRDHVLRNIQDVYTIPRLEDLVHRRVGGDKSVRRISESCKRATAQGFRPLMIIDEPQYGASDRMVTSDTGPVRRPCMLVQIFDRIEQELNSTRDDHWFVGLSATPFELNDLERVWEVRQYLSENYSGFNFFNQRPISDDVRIVPPVTLSLGGFGDSIGCPFMRNVSMAAYGGPEKSFTRHAKKIGYDGTQDDYRVDVQDALRESIYAVLDEYEEEEEEGPPVGLCIRAFNDNAKTTALIQQLALDPELIEVIEYFGPRSTNVSVKRAIAQRQRPDLPLVLFCTNRARMADAFPTNVRFFMDLAEKAADLNSLLQGLLGRACGYNKRSTVVLSDANTTYVNDYVATLGGYVHRPSRHTVTVGGFRRHATNMLKIRIEMEDPKVQAFFEEIDKRVVTPNLTDPAKLSVARASSGARYRTGPILEIAERLGLFDHLESPEIRGKFYSQFPSGFQVARSGDSIRHARKSGVILRYSVNSEGFCRYTFRWSERAAKAQGGGAGRTQGAKDVSQHVEPTVYLEKFDPETGEIIRDRNAPDEQKRPGAWRAFMVTFPLREPVKEVYPADVAFPVAFSPYADWMTDEEKAARDQRGGRRPRS